MSTPGELRERLLKPFKVVCVDNHAYLGSTPDGFPSAPSPDELLDESLTIGKVYEVTAEHIGMWAIVDDTGGSYYFPKSRFRILKPGEEIDEPPTSTWT